MQFAAFLMKIMSNAEMGIECNDTYGASYTKCRIFPHFDGV